jgi:hypothetical protein
MQHQGGRYSLISRTTILGEAKCLKIFTTIYIITISRGSHGLCTLNLGVGGGDAIIYEGYYRYRTQTVWLPVPLARENSFCGDCGRRASDVEVPSTWDRPSKWLSRQITAGGICAPIVLLGGYTSRKFTTAFTCSMARAVTLGVCVAAIHHRAAAGRRGGVSNVSSRSCEVSPFDYVFPAFLAKSFGHREQGPVHAEEDRNVDGCSPARKKDYRRMCLWKRWGWSFALHTRFEACSAQAGGSYVISRWIKSRRSAASITAVPVTGIYVVEVRRGGLCRTTHPKTHVFGVRDRGGSG